MKDHLIRKAFGCALSIACPLLLQAGPSAGDIFAEDGFFVGCNYWASHAGVYMWRDWRPDQVEKDLDVMAAHGMTVLRVFPLWPDFQPLTADFGARQLIRSYSQNGLPMQNEAAVDETMMQRFRFLCDAAQRRNLKLVVGLVTGWMSGRTFVPPALERMKVLSDPEAIRWEVRFVRYFVNAMKDHPAIAAWDLGNECNCLGEIDDAGLWAWMHHISSEIRVCDPTRRVIAGMHGCSTKRNGWTNLRQQGELTDVLTTHPYPLWTPECNLEPFDTIRNGCHAACETTLYANIGGRPAFPEEAGSMGPQIVGEDRAAASMRMALFSCWAAGLPGFLWWCGFDQDRMSHPPYDWTAIERELGLFTGDLKPKPTAVALKEFATFLKSFPYRKLPPRRIDAIVVTTEVEDGWTSSLGAWLLSRQAGFDIAYARAEDALPQSRFYILPSGDTYDTYSRKAFWQVMDKVREGATVFISLGNGAVLSNLEEIAGVRTENHYRRPTTREVQSSCGSFALTEPYTRVISLIDGTKVVAVDERGDPVMTEREYGKGKVLFFSGAVEKNAAIAGYSAYRLAAECAGVKRDVTVDCRSVGLTEHVLADGRLLVVAVNYEPKVMRCRLKTELGIEKVYRGSVSGMELVIQPNDAAVLLFRTNQKRQL